MKESTFSEQHSKFRTSKEWKAFRLSIIEERQKKCECCGVQKNNASRLQLHHIFPLDYTNLSPERFALLCANCHAEIERLSKRLRGKKAGTIENLDAWMELYGRFLPHY
jgi:hypothetical protein